MQKNKMKKFDYKKVLKYGLIWVGGIVSFGTNGYYCWEHDPEKKEIARQEKKNLSVLKKAEVFMAKYLALEDVEFPYENKQFDVDLENTFKTLVKNRENRDFYQDVFKPEVASLLGVQEDHVYAYLKAAGLRLNENKTVLYNLKSNIALDQFTRIIDNQLGPKGAAAKTPSLMVHLEDVQTKTEMKTSSDETAAKNIPQRPLSDTKEYMKPSVFLEQFRHSRPLG